MTIYLYRLVSRQQIGFHSISSFSNALLLLPAAFWLNGREGARDHNLSAIISRLMVFLMALLPFFLLGTSALV